MTRERMYKWGARVAMAVRRLFLSPLVHRVKTIGQRSGRRTLRIAAGYRHAGESHQYAPNPRVSVVNITAC